MKYIKFNSPISGHVSNTQTIYSFPVGAYAEWNDTEAERLAERGIAEILPAAKVAELKSQGVVFQTEPKGPNR